MSGPAVADLPQRAELGVPALPATGPWVPHWSSWSIVLIFNLLGRWLVGRARPTRHDDRGSPAKSTGAANVQAPPERRAIPGGADRSSCSQPATAARPRVRTSFADIQDLNAYYGERLRGPRRHAPGSRARDHRDHRPVGQRQVDPPPLHRPDARGRSPGPGSTGRIRYRGVDIYRSRRRPGRGPARDRDGLPAAQSVPDDVDLRQRRRAGPVQRRGQGQGRADGARRAMPSPGGPVGRGQGQAQAQRARPCRAASSNGCASLGRWRSRPTCS